MTESAEKKVPAPTADETGTYKVRFYQEMILTLREGQTKAQLEAAAALIRDNTMKGFEILVEKTTEPGDGRWLLEGTNFARVPEPVADIAALRVLEATEGDIAGVTAEGGRPYVYLPNFQQAAITANNLNLQYIVSSSKGGIWMDLQYFTQFMQAQKQMQARQQQAAQLQTQQARPPQNGMKMPQPFRK